MRPPPKPIPVLPLSLPRLVPWRGAAPTLLIREGDRAAALLDVIDNDEDVSLLVLAASPRGQGPGLLIDSLLASDATPFPVPIAIVPAGLSNAQIDAVA